jgi:hypothetical protein
MSALTVPNCRIGVLPDSSRTAKASPVVTAEPTSAAPVLRSVSRMASSACRPRLRASR